MTYGHVAVGWLRARKRSPSVRKITRVPCFAQPRCVFRHHIQHRLNFRRRASDNAQDFTRRRLLLQLISLSSLNNRTFSMAITAWSAKVSSSLICAGVKGRTSMRRALSNPMSSPC